jgi:hypothetical protein
MIIIFYRRLPTATLAIFHHQITALGAGGCEPHNDDENLPLISRNVAD